MFVKKVTPLTLHNNSPGWLWQTCVTQNGHWGQDYTPLQFSFPNLLNKRTDNNE